MAGRFHLSTQHAPRASRARDLLRAYREVRAATQALSAPLQCEDFVAQSMPDASPTKWHLAHTTWFFEEFVLKPFAKGYRAFNPAFGYLFNSYYEAVGPRHSRPHRGLLTRPTVRETFVYRRHVDEHIIALLENNDVSGQILERITLGLHHEQQHQELILTDIKHLFSQNPLLPAYTSSTPKPVREAPAMRFIAFDGGLIETGHSGDGFCFDNELPRHRTYIQPFELANRLVTNGEFREFIRDGGYTRPQLWLSDGWATVQREGWQRPLYWAESLEEEFTLCGVRQLDIHAPVTHLSFYEAHAFATWVNARLPTEFEWEHAAATLPIEGNFVENKHWHPTAADSATGLVQMFGDVWEWTQSAYAPYPGFRPAAGALGEYNGKFMINQVVLRGGSCATPRSHIRATYRNFFPPAARWQFSGLRLARDAHA